MISPVLPGVQKIGLGSQNFGSPLVPPGVPHGQTESGGIVLAAICWSPCAQMLPDRALCSVLPDLRALCLPTLSHFSVVNTTSLSLSPWRSRPSHVAYRHTTTPRWRYKDEILVYVLTERLPERAPDDIPLSTTASNQTLSLSVPLSCPSTKRAIAEVGKAQDF